MWGRANWIILSLTAAYVVSAYLLAWRFGFRVEPLPDYQAQMYFANAAFGLGIFFLWSLFKDKPASPFRYIPGWATSYRLKERLLAAIPVLFLLGVMLSVFGSIKIAIPDMQPYAYDPLFADWDDAIHGGPAWELVHPILGFPVVTFAINLIYNSWFVAFYGTMVFVSGWIERPALRQQFLVAFFLCWVILGSVGAVLSASVGPCFYDDYFASERFAPLMGYLAQANMQFPINALDVQDWLLRVQQMRDSGIGKGISAMPSMHISVVVLLAILGWKVSRRWGFAATAFAVLIFLGSIHLGYHYAVDGYVSMVVTPLIWAAAGWGSRFTSSRRPATVWA